MASDFIYLPDRAIISLSGPDTLTLLERLVTHATDDWDESTTRYGALLTPQGKILSDFLAIRTESGVLLDTASAFADDLAKRLKMFRLRSQVEIERLDDVAVVAGIAAAGNVAPSIPGAERVYVDPRYSDGRARGLINSDQWTTTHDTPLQTDPQGLAAYHADRIAHGVPEQGADFGTADAFPADVNMDVLGGVALNKGCFVGQEVVSRMHRRGQIRKRTLTVSIANGATMKTQDDLLAPASIGTVTSHQDTIGLARIRVDRWQNAVADGAAIELNETPVTIAKPDWLVAELSAKT
jgi:hypothetical protein